MSLSSSSSGASSIEHLQYKLVLLGDAAVGKTSIVKRLVQHSHEATYTPTVGVEFYRAQVHITDDIHAVLQIWDLGSHVSSITMAANYLHGCDAVLAVYDATRQETYLQTCEWMELLQQMFQETALPYIAVIANKVESEALVQTATDQLQAATASIQTAYGYHLSARTGANLKTTFLRIAADLAGIPLTQQQMDAALHQQAQASSNSKAAEDGLKQRAQQPASKSSKIGVSSVFPCFRASAIASDSNSSTAQRNSGDNNLSAGTSGHVGGGTRLAGSDFRQPQKQMASQNGGEDELNGQTSHAQSRVVKLSCEMMLQSCSCCTCWPWTSRVSCL